MTDGPVIIVGAGQGGVEAAACLRADGFTGPVTLIGDEAVVPYERPPLSKNYLLDGDAEALSLRPRDFYRQHEIKLLSGRRVVSIDRAANTVEDDQGGRHPYGHLILATGATPFLPPIDGIGLPGVHVLRTRADADVLRERLKTAKRVLVIGGGFVGMEFAAVARTLGMDVHVIESSTRLMSRAVSPKMSEVFLAAHRREGVCVSLNRQVERIVAGSDGRASGAVTADGTHLAADCILVGAGARPNVDLAVAAGLAVADGIVVDSHLLTGDPSISALGDCARFPVPLAERSVRLESVQAATDHARAISRRLAAGVMEPFNAVPWFWSDQGNLTLQIAGLAEPHDDAVFVERGEGKLAVYRYRQEKLIALETINVPAEHAAARKLLALPSAATRTELERLGYDLRTAVKQRLKK